MFSNTIHFKYQAFYSYNPNNSISLLHNLKVNGSHKLIRSHYLNGHLLPQLICLMCNLTVELIVSLIEYIVVILQGIYVNHPLYGIRQLHIEAVCGYSGYYSVIHIADTL